MARRSRIPLTYHLPALFGLESLRSGEDEIAGLVILGSGASVYDGAPWQHAMADWLRPRLVSGLPILAICYGHQLVASLLGGEVGWLFEEKRAGLREVRLSANPLWGDPRVGPVMVSHRQGVVKVPDEFEVAGSSDEVAVEALVHRRLPIWTFQFHPEATAQFAVNNSVPFDGSAASLTFGHSLVDAFLDRVAAG
jgi:GMP synthase (glutamine-hydrolysing)